METTLELVTPTLQRAGDYGPALIKDVRGWHSCLPPRGSPGHPFDIHLAATEDARYSASQLLNNQYERRGYGALHRIEPHPHRLTLAAATLQGLIGTVSLGTDSPSGLLVDEAFKPEIDAQRARGSRLCEFTKLAMAPVAHPELTLGALFHTVYLYAHKVHNCTDAFIEINPRHRRYYETMLGFRSMSAEPRISPRVNAPAYLLHISLDYMAEQIALQAGKPQPAGAPGRSLYPYFFGGNAAATLMKSLLTSVDEQTCNQSR